MRRTGIRWRLAPVRGMKICGSGRVGLLVKGADFFSGKTRIVARRRNPLGNFTCLGERADGN